MTKKVRKEIQVVLTQAIPKLGESGTLLKVKSGYARNYLIPQQLGELATPKALKILKQRQKEVEAKEKTLIDQSIKNKDILERSGPYIIQKRVGEENKIFGKITLKQIIEVLKERTKLDLNNVTIDLPEIKELGSFSLNVVLHSSVKAIIKIDILPQ